MPGPYDFPAYPPSEYDPPPQAPLAPMPTAQFNQLNQPGALPPDQQNILIDQVQRMLRSPVKEERDAAQRFVNQFSRSPFMLGLDRATRLPFNMVPPGPGGRQQGLSDYLATQGQTGAYSPPNIEFANALTRRVRPGEAEGAEVAGNAVNMLPYFLAGKRLPLGGIPGGRLPGGPPPQGPQSPLIPEPPPAGWLDSTPINPGAPPLSPAGPREMQGPPQFPRFLERMRSGQDSPPGAPSGPEPLPTAGELRTGEFLDKGSPIPQWRFQPRGPDGRFQKGQQEYRDVAPGGYDPFSLLRRRRNE